MLAAFRHALADPLSAAGMKLEIVERKLRVPSRDPSVENLASRVESVKGDLAELGRLLDLLNVVSNLLDEPRRRMTVGELTEVGGVAPEVAFAARPESVGEALRRIVAFGSARGGTPSLRFTPGAAGVAVAAAGLGPPPAGSLERLLSLPRATPGAEDLYIARACVELDGGSLELRVSDGSLEAELRWPGSG